MKSFYLSGTSIIIAIAFLASMLVMANQVSAKEFQSNSNLAPGACGSDASISRALDQCGRKGFKFADCKQKNGVWTCTGTKNKTKPNSRPTGIKK